MYNSQHIISAKHYLVLCCIAFAFGIFLFVYLNNFLLSIMIFALSTALIVLSVFVVLYFSKHIKVRLKCILLPLTLIFFVICGTARIYMFENSDSNILRTYQDDEAWLCGCVSSVPQITSSGFYHSFEFEVVQVNSNPDAKGTVMMYLPKGRGEDISIGDKLCCWAELSAPNRAEASDNLDYYTHLRGKNIFLIAKTQNANQVSFDTDMNLKSYIKALGLSIRTKISQNISLIFANDNTSSAILKGILLGDKSDFTNELYKRFSNSGISHIVAVSGLHMSVLFGFILLILSHSHIKRKMALLITIPFILIFMSVSVFSPSVCRAAIMLLITILAAFTRRPYDPVTALFFAFGVILTLTPYSLFSKSLILSFSATLGIFAFYKYLIYLISKPIRLKKSSILLKPINFILSSLSLSAATLIGTSYFLILFFGSISMVQFLTNLWIIPIVIIVFCLGYTACLTYMISPALSIFVFKTPLSALLNIIKATVNTFGDDRFAVAIHLESMPKHALPIYIGAAIILYFFLKLYYDMDMDKIKNG